MLSLIIKIKFIRLIKFIKNLGDPAGDLDVLDGSAAAAADGSAAESLGSAAGNLGFAAG